MGGTALPAKRYPAALDGNGVHSGKPLATKHSVGDGFLSPMQEPSGFDEVCLSAAHKQKAERTGHIACKRGHLTRPALPDARTVGYNPMGCHTRAGYCGLPILSLPYLNPSVKILQGSDLDQDLRILYHGLLSHSSGEIEKDGNRLSPAHVLCDDDSGKCQP